MKISLNGGNTGARKWQDAVMFSKGGKMTWSTPFGESTLTRTNILKMPHMQDTTILRLKQRL